MARIVADRVKETTTTIGTGALTLAGAVANFVTFASKMAVGDTCYYCIEDVPNTAWEVGLGTYSGTNTLTRTTVLASSNGGSVVTFAAGTKSVWLDLAAAQVGYGYLSRGAWDAATTYAAYDVVTYSGSSWVGLDASTGVVPGTDGTKWQLFAQRGDVGATGSQGVPGTSVGNALLNGGQVVWTTAYTYIVSAATYTINGVLYHSPQTSVTLTAADPSLDRIDSFVLTSSSTAVAVAGTAANPPVEPSLDPLTQLQVAFAYVAAGSVTATVGSTTIYAENTEWTTSTSGGTINAASTSNPRTGSKDVEATAAANTNYVQFATSPTFNPGDYNLLVLYMRSKAAWPSNKSVVAQFYNGATARGSAVTLKTGAYGFDSANTTDYQQIAIPITAFGLSGLLVDRLRLTVTGGGATIGFYVDDISLQRGVAVSTPATGLQYRGDYVAATQYVVNDLVRYGGVAWVALAGSVGTRPGTNSAVWAYLVNPASSFLISQVFS